MQNYFEKLSPNYKESNYWLLCEEISNELNEKLERVTEQISDAKLYLLEAIDTLKRSVETLRELCRNKDRASKMAHARRLLHKMKLPLCLTTPADRMTLLPERLKQNQDWLQNEIIISKQTECSHEQLKAIPEFKSLLDNFSDFVLLSP